MRTRILLASLAALLVAGGWFVQHAAAESLRFQLENARADQRELARLQADRDRLLRAQPSATHLAVLREAPAERERLRRMIAERTPPPPATTLPLGEWIPAHAWQNRGHTTPRATVESALWAAAGGDVPAFQAALALEPEARAKAAALLARLPSGVRALYPTPESFVASATMKRIPLSEAQVAWLHQADADHAAIGVLWHQPSHASNVAADSAGVVGTPPPMLPDSQRTGLAALTLRRSETGWRIVVPGEAVDRLAHEFTGQ